MVLIVYHIDDFFDLNKLSYFFHQNVYFHFKIRDTFLLHWINFELSFYSEDWSYFKFKNYKFPKIIDKYVSKVCIKNILEKEALQ